MAQALILTTPTTMTSPPPGTPKLQSSGDIEVITSDRFSGTDTSTIAGRLTDAGLGGEKLAWKTYGSAPISIAGGALLWGPASGTYFSYVDIQRVDVDLTMSLKILALPASGGPYFDIFRDAPDSSTATRLRAAITPAGAVSFSHNTPAGSTPISGASLTISAGDTLGIRYNNRTGVLTTYKNGAVASTVTTGRTYAGTLFGFAGVGVSADMRIDDMTLTRTIF